MKTSRSTYFMADYAGSDRRSVRAHLEGKSMRAAAYSVFHAFEAMLGRSSKAPQDFLRLSRFFFKRSDGFARAGRALSYGVTAVVGLVAGGALYFFLVS